MKCVRYNLAFLIINTERYRSGERAEARPADGEAGKKDINAEKARSGKKLLLRCLLLGVVKTVYDILFLYGLNYFDVSTGAFTFCITVVVLPVILLTMKKGVSKKTWVSVILVMAGIVCALGGTLVNAQLMGLIIMLIGCTVRAFFIVKLNEYAKEHDPMTPSPYHIIGALFIVAGSLIEIVELKGRRVRNEIEG